MVDICAKWYGKLEKDVDFMHWNQILNPVGLALDVHTWVIYSLHGLVTECTCVIDMKIGRIL